MTYAYRVEYLPGARVECFIPVRFVALTQEWEPRSINSSVYARRLTHRQMIYVRARAVRLKVVPASPPIPLTCLPII